MNAVQRKGSHTAAATAGAHAAKLHRVAGWVRDGLLIAVLSISFLFLICFGGVTKSFAATGGIALSDVNLRAGPSTRYPVVSVLPRSASLSVYGCIADQSWCDIGWGGYRGWVAASYVQVIYKGQPTVLTAAVVPAVGIATVAFTVAYWDAHYHAQPWYGHWNRYYGGYSRSVAVGCNDNGCDAAAVTHGPRGGGRHVAGGCQDGNCGGAAVTHGPRGGGKAAIGGCNDERCAGASVTRGPRGNTVIRHGGFDRP
ncbi:MULTISPECIES: SH3 domain-containing protein [unclassified Rhizobium]|uniref:SH3 domain-containing protein n=1 Tax=unclassified Rhizobium TaxID=2613769 RepID=UPI001AD9F689|nr:MULTISPECIES: SH3 domain-containing protein [unclassified Rhizobium]MBO9126653.1 SH3 domain-containing protein [Rhizobium sp. 16-488-2b]MBO9177100.1 SH3 domain-containing protein [Rhizobium sp. 16-488-2a]